jgi:hypothetical protein
LDRNGDGKVTLQDLEDLCTKYLTSKIWLHSPLSYQQSKKIYLSSFLEWLIKINNIIKIFCFSIELYKIFDLLCQLKWLKSNSIDEVLIW